MLNHNEVQADKVKYSKQKDLQMSLNKLYINPDFKKLFMDYYCNEYVLELVKSLSMYPENSLEHQETLKELSVISSFQKFLDTVQTNGAMAIQSLDELDAIPLSEISDE